jgi:hypothetical protein
MPAEAPRGPWHVEPGPTLEGVCRATAAVAVGRHVVVAAGDRPVLSVFDWTRAAAPAGAIDLEALHPDLAGVRVAGLALGPDGRVWAASTDRLFALRTIERDTGLDATLDAGPTSRLATVGGHVKGLEGLVPSAAGRPPGDPLGLALGGLATDPDGALVVGYHTPVQAGRALLEPIADPDVYVRGGDVTTSGPRWLALAGRGVSAIERDGDHLLVLAGADGAGPVVLARAGAPPDGSPPVLLPVAFDDLAPGALFSADGAWWVASDEGDRCDPSRPRARTARIPAEALTGAAAPTL